MLSRRSPIIRMLLVLVVYSTSCLSSSVFADQAIRETPLVRAVAHSRKAVVNLRGRKTVRADNTAVSGDAMKQVNGMGTGVIIDSRGYILTNYHVVQGVRQIQVITADDEQTIGQLMAHDPTTDLAIIKINLPKTLPTIDIGTSSDLMLAETVAAVGNAYGYEHTVTVGIISQLGRTVQVNDDQVYRNLIQTDAPINPGNSGGPLLNLEGKMIGINVAVRIGAQGIAFAIPVNDAMEVASRLIEKITEETVFHGIQSTTVFKDHSPQLFVDAIDPASPAAKIGLTKGDQILEINGEKVHRSLDFQRALLDRTPLQKISMSVSRSGNVRNVDLQLSRDSRVAKSEAWKSLGLKVVPATAAEMANRHKSYKRGLRITKVRPGSPAETEGIMPGDVLVAMHGWKTETMDNLKFILQQPDVKQRKEFLFYVLREKEPFWGQMRIASKFR